MKNKHGISYKTNFFKDRFIYTLILYSVIVSIIAVFFGADLHFILGIICGTLLGIYKIYSIKNSLNRAVGLSEDKAVTYSQRQYLVRYILTGIILLAAALNGVQTLLGVFIALLGMKFSAYMELIKRK